MKLTGEDILIIFLGTGIGLLFYVNDWPVSFQLVQLLINFHFISKYFRSKGTSNPFRKIDLLFFYLIFNQITTISNIAVVNSIGTPQESEYNYYLSVEDINDALFIAYIGNLSFIIGYCLVSSNKNWKISWVFPSETMLKNIFFIIATSVVILTYTIGKQDIFDFIYYPILFITIRHFASRGNNIVIYYALISVLLICFYSLNFAYRRQEIIQPLIIILIAYITGRENIKALSSTFSLIIISLGIIFSLLFYKMGEVRNLTGEKRLEKLFSKEKKEFTNIDNENEEKGIIARSSNINQLSQVKRLVRENGSYEGITFNYFFFAFIPRFLWPQKPMIMQGRWFALEAGLAYNHGQAGSLLEVNNSVNMTLPGELFLNYGYIAVAMGLCLVGMCFRYLWDITSFWDNPLNLSGTIFSLFLISVTYFYINVDSQFIVNVVQIFIFSILINFFLNKVYPPNNI